MLENRTPDITAFEDFAKKIGLKRVEGAIYGLLVLSDRPLSSEEIETQLNIGQGTVSVALKNLALFGIIDSRDWRDRPSELSNCHPKTKWHTARTDSLSIVATIFRKREQAFIEEFKMNAERLIDQFCSQGEGQDSVRIRRLKSIVNTSRIAESVMEFVIELSKYESNTHYQKIVEQLPQVLKILIKGEQMAQGVASTLDRTFQAAHKLAQVEASNIKKSLQEGIRERWGRYHAGNNADGEEHMSTESYS